MTAPTPERRVGEAEPINGLSLIDDLVPLWNAINVFADAPKSSTRRADAVVVVERVVAGIRDRKAAPLATEVARLKACLEQQALQFDTLGHPVLADAARLQAAWSPECAPPTPAREGAANDE